MPLERAVLKIWKIIAPFDGLIYSFLSQPTVQFQNTGRKQKNNFNQISFTFLQNTIFCTHRLLNIEIPNVIEWLKMIQEEIPTLDDNNLASVLKKAKLGAQLAAPT